MKKLLAISTFAIGCAVALCATPAWSFPSSITLDFNGSGSTLAATGFDAAYNLNTSGFTVGGGRLTMQTLPGDTFGQYTPPDTDPDTAQNVFYSVIDNNPLTTVQASVRYTNLNSNFHGGGIWLGTDTDHYFRLALFNNTFEGGIAVEGLRENQDRWGGATPPGPGDDIVGRVIPNIATSPQGAAIDAVLRIVRAGSNVQAFASINGGPFQQVGGPGFTFTGFASPGDPQGSGSNTQEAPVSLKVGVYAVGGGATPANIAFDSLTATSTVPEPASLGALAIAAGLIWRRRRT